MEMARFYSLPRYYDIALHRPGIDDEIGRLGAVFSAHARVPVRRVLEPACGSGLITCALARHGFDVVGYDYSPAMVDYTRRRIVAEGLVDRASCVQGDMRDTVMVPPADGALICVNSVGYCVTDEDVRRHFQAMSRSLRLGGVYVIEASMACVDLRNDDPLVERRETDGIRVDVRWLPDAYDRSRKIRHVTLHLDVRDRDTEVSFTEEHPLRLWLFEDLCSLAHEAGFAVDAAYTQEFAKVPLDRPVTGELGALYFVLVKMRDLVVQ